MMVFGDLDERIGEIKQNPFYIPYIEKLKREYEAEREQEPPALSYTDFEEFYISGRRSGYEQVYFKKRTRLHRAAILYLLFDEEEYKNELCNMIWYTCSEISWVIPAHLNCSEVADYRTHIDLFASETAQTLAEILYLLENRLPKKIVDLIKTELKERIFDAYEAKNFWWENLKSNWAAVCAGGVGMAYMYMAPERFCGVKERILKTIKSFLDGYGDDGCCLEGVSYWQYGFGFYLEFADVYYHFTNGECDLRHSEKVDKIAQYLQKMIMRKNVAVSFSDSSRTYNISHIGLISYLINNYDGIDIPVFQSDLSEFLKSNGWSYLVRNFLWSNPEHFISVKPFKEDFSYFKNAQWYVVKKEKYSFVAKGGHNAEEHNHNDVGSFIFADDTGQLFADLGAMEYTDANFCQKTRYTFLQNSSLGHSVPIIDGMAQEFGRQFYAKVLSVDEKQFCMELQTAYNTDIQRITRCFKMNENGITLIDEYAGAKGHLIKERFVSVIEPKLTDDGIRIGDAFLKADGFSGIKTEILRSADLTNITVYLIDYIVNGDSFEAQIILM